jgi:hypothetical protein
MDSTIGTSRQEIGTSRKEIKETALDAFHKYNNSIIDNELGGDVKLEHQTKSTPNPYSTLTLKSS